MLRRFRFFDVAYGPWKFWQKKIFSTTRASIQFVTICMATRNFPRFLQRIELSSGWRIWKPISTIRFAGLNRPLGGGRYLRLLAMAYTCWAIRRHQQDDDRSYFTFIPGNSTPASRDSKGNGNPNSVTTPASRAWKVGWKLCLAAVTSNPFKTSSPGYEPPLLSCRYRRFEPTRAGRESPARLVPDFRYFSANCELLATLMFRLLSEVPVESRFASAW